MRDGAVQIADHENAVVNRDTYCLFVADIFVVTMIYDRRDCFISNRREN